MSGRWEALGWIPDNVARYDDRDLATLAQALTQALDAVTSEQARRTPDQPQEDQP